MAVGWSEPPLFDGWAPGLVKPAALWPTVDPDEVGLDEQARWLWPTAVDGEPGSGAGWSESWTERGPGAVGRETSW